MSDLTPDLIAFLTAVRDALDIPLGDTAEDDRGRALLLNRRASDAAIILDGVIRGDRVADCTDQLLGWTARQPVTYTAWVPGQAEDGETR